MLSVPVATTGNWSVALVVAVVATVVIVGLIAALVSVIRAARQLRQAALDLGRQSERLLSELDGALGEANAELERVDDLVDSAEHLTETLSAASHAAYLTVARPLIKVLALRHGVARAAGYLRSSRKPGRVGPAGTRGHLGRSREALAAGDHRPAADRRPTGTGWR